MVKRNLKRPAGETVNIMPASRYSFEGI